MKHKSMAYLLHVSTPQVTQNSKVMSVICQIVRLCHWGEDQWFLNTVTMVQ